MSKSFNLGMKSFLRMLSEASDEADSHSSGGKYSSIFKEGLLSPVPEIVRLHVT
jgi:hypothetical protein